MDNILTWTVLNGREMRRQIHEIYTRRNCCWISKESWIYDLKGSQWNKFELSVKLSSDEKEEVDHLVFVVHGIGTVGDVKRRSFVDCGR